MLKQKFKTLINHPFRVLKKYSYLTASKLVGYPIAHLDTNYERFFRVEKGEVVVDVGAQIGLFSISVSKRAKTVVAIEPEPTNLRHLHYNIKLRKSNNVLIVQKAVWNCKTKLTLYLGVHSGAHSAIKDVTAKGKSTIINRKIMVDADTLDNILRELCLSKIDFIKIDIEGAEIEALEGAEQTLKNTHKIMIASYHERNGIKTSHKIAQTLINSGFKTYIAENNLVYGYKR